MSNCRILIGSSVCQSPEILGKFLDSLNRLELSEFDASFMFIDDNQNEISSDMLKSFKPGYKTAVMPAPPRESSYYTDETTHYWDNSLVMRVAALKNGIISRTIDENYDYLFLIDSDLIVDPVLISHLHKQDKDVVSEIFWTSWQPGTLPLPNTWMYDKYEMAHPSLDADARAAITEEFLSNLRRPGCYEVGGLGACTLIKVPALKRGLDFSPIKNVSFWGEDRWFCIRAAAYGIKLFIDTHYPAKHLYRMSDL